jgi:hypothetical protein
MPTLHGTRFDRIIFLKIGQFNNMSIHAEKHKSLIRFVTVVINDFKFIFVYMHL